MIYSASIEYGWPDGTPRRDGLMIEGEPFVDLSDTHHPVLVVTLAAKNGPGRFVRVMYPVENLIKWRIEEYLGPSLDKTDDDKET